MTRTPGYDGIIGVEELARQIRIGNDSSPGETPLRIYDASVVFTADSNGRPMAKPGRNAFLDGHIPGARFVDHQIDLSDQESELRYTLLEPANLEVALRGLGINNESSVVIYSTTHLMWATRLWWILRACGLTDVRVLDGGFDAWQAAGQPTTPGEEPAWPHGDLTIDFDPERWADVKEVEASVGSDSVCTVNALTADIHAGSSPISYGRPGHISGSVNVPFDSLSKGSKLLPWDQIRALFTQQDAFMRERVVTYCGGGIAATLAAFALQQLGHPNVAVYDGSLSEWSRDPDRPMETGA